MNGPRIYTEIPIFGGIPITETMVNSWIVMAVIVIFALVATRKLQRVPGKLQSAVEIGVESLYKLVEDTMGKDKLSFAPYIGTLFLFSLLCSLSSLFGLRPPTGDLNTTAGWALVTFFLVQFNGIRRKGIKGWLKGFVEPIPFMLPLNIVSEFANPLSLAFRHYGNIAAGIVITSLVYQGLGGLSSAIFGSWLPPILQIGLPAILSIYFDLFTSVLQAFIFCILTMSFVAMAMDD